MRFLGVEILFAAGTSNYNYTRSCATYLSEAPHNPDIPDGDSQHVKNSVVEMRKVPIDAAAQFVFGSSAGMRDKSCSCSSPEDPLPGPLKLALLTWYAGGGGETPGLEDWEQQVHTGMACEIKCDSRADDRSDEQIDSGELLPLQCVTGFGPPKTLETWG